MPFTYKSGKDGTLITDIPDGIDVNTSTDLDAALAKARSSGEKSLSWSSMFPDATQQPLDTQNIQNAQVSGLGRGAAIAGGGALKGFGEAASMIGDPVQRLVNTILGKDNMLPSEALPVFLEKIGVPEAQTRAEEILQSTAEGIGGTAAMVAAGGLPALSAGATTKGAQTLGQMALKEGAKQAVGGAAYGATKGIVEQAGAPPIVQEALGMAAGIGGTSLAGLRPSALAKAPIEEAEQAGVRLLTSDIRGPKTFAGKWLQGFSEKIPVFGTGGTRKLQAAERIAAVDDLVRNYGADELQGLSEGIMDDLLSTRSAEVSKWSKYKNEVIDRLSIPENQAQAQIGGPTKLIDAPQGISQSKIVPMVETSKKIDDTITYLKQLKTKEIQPAIDALSDWKKAIQGQDLRNIETLRSQIGEVFKSSELSATRKTTEKALSGIYDSVRTDMGNYIKKNGGADAYTKWKDANDKLAGMMKELKIPALKTVLKRGESTPEKINSLLFSSNRSDIEALYRNLSPEGKGIARSAIIAKAYENAKGEVVSPNKFADQVSKLGNQVGVFFTGDDLMQLQGLQRVLEYTKRAEQAALSPPTGVQNVLPVGAAALASYFGGGLDGFIAAMGTGAGIGTVARIYESKPVRTLLSKLPTLKPGSKEESAILEQLLVAAQRANLGSQEQSKQAGSARSAWEESLYKENKGENQGGRTWQ